MRHPGGCPHRAEEWMQRVEVHIGAIEDTERVKSLVREREIAHIVHLAGVLIPFCQANAVRGLWPT